MSSSIETRKLSNTYEFAKCATALIEVALKEGRKLSDIDRAVIAHAIAALQASLES